MDKSRACGFELTGQSFILTERHGDHAAESGKEDMRRDSKADLANLGQQMNAAMAMQEQMKNMPPEQRAMIEQMMKARGGLRGMPPTAQEVRVEYKPAGSDQVGQWSCTKYEGFRGQEKVAEVCAVDPKEFGLTPSDFEVIKQSGILQGTRPG
jgi:hypothetical protein